MKMPVRFKAMVERKTATQDLLFDVDVRGYFIGKGGKPDFITEGMTVVGMPNMNMNGFFPKEVEEIRKYAMRVEHPRLLGLPCVWILSPGFRIFVHSQPATPTHHHTSCA